MDNFIVSARKYRPSTFDMVVGQSSITSTLQNAIKTNTLAQAFLFCGPRGVGKTTCARIMAKTINCLNPTPGMEACNACESCVSFNNSNSFNIYELDAASNNSVDDIRNLVDQVRIPPQVGKFKVYIIDEVHMLSPSAFNAFLKTLEEPPAYAKFILATTEKHKIIPTILSRCQIFDFKRITVNDTCKHLQYVAEKEGVEAELEALSVIAQKADGAMRDALSIFDQMVSFSGKHITYRDTIENLNVLDYDYYFRITESILGGHTSEILLTLDEIIDNGFDLQHFIHGMGKHLRNLLVSKDPMTVPLMEMSQSLQERYIQQSIHCPVVFLLKALEINNQCDLNYRSSNNKRLSLEISLLQMCTIQNAASQPISQVKLPQNKPANAPVSQQTQVRQPAPAPQSVQQQTSTVNAPASYMQKVETEAPRTVVREVATSRQQTTRSISINVPIEKEKVKEDEQEPVADNPFTQEQLVDEWKKFVEKYKGVSPSFSTAIGRYEPILGENFVITYQIDNSLIATEKVHINALFTHLKKAFHNNQFKLLPEIPQNPKSVEAYTDKEKFEKLSKENPMLRTLQNELNLEPEL